MGPDVPSSASECIDSIDTPSSATTACLSASLLASSIWPTGVFSPLLANKRLMASRVPEPGSR